METLLKKAEDLKPGDIIPDADGAAVQSIEVDRGTVYISYPNFTLFCAKGDLVEVAQ